MTYQRGDRVRVVLTPEEDAYGGQRGTVTRSEVPGLPGTIYVRLDGGTEEPFNVGEVRQVEGVDPFAGLDVPFTDH